MWDRDQSRYWNTVAGEYDALYTSRWSGLEDAQLAAALRRVVPPAARVLDLGCGTGLGYALLPKNEEIAYVGFDLSVAMLAQARAKWPDIPLVNGTTAELAMFRSNSFDAVIALNTALSYAADIQDVLAQAHRLLRAPGRIMISTISRFATRRLIRCRIGIEHRYRTRGSQHKATVVARTYSVAALKRLLDEAGFVDVRVWGQSALGGIAEYAPLWNLDQRISAVLPNLGCTLYAEAVRA